MTGFRNAVAACSLVLLVGCSLPATKSAAPEAAGSPVTSAASDSPSPSPSGQPQGLIAPPVPTGAPVPPTTAAPPAVPRKAPAPKKTTKKPAPKPTKTTKPPQAGVHPGAFCAPPGAYGYTSAGTLMHCTPKAGDIRARWRAA
jgi:hypothetical protein